jgi:hypothetical protein
VLWLASFQDAKSLRLISGGVAALDHRLIASNPSGSGKTTFIARFAGPQRRSSLRSERKKLDEANCFEPFGFWEDHLHRAIYRTSTAQLTEKRAKKAE